MKKELLYKALKLVSTFIVYEVPHQSLSYQWIQISTFAVHPRQGLVKFFILECWSKIIQLLMPSNHALAPKLPIEFWSVTYYYNHVNSGINFILNSLNI